MSLLELLGRGSRELLSNGAVTAVSAAALASFFAVMKNLTYDLTSQFLKRRREKVQPQSPPRLAEMLLGLLGPKGLVDAMLGDLQEKFLEDCAKHGRPFAVRAYWYAVVRSVGPLVFEKLRRWGVIVAVLEYGRRKFGL